MAENTEKTEVNNTIVPQEEFRTDMADLMKSNKEQADYAKRAWVMSLISTFAVVIVAVFLIGVCLFYMPKINLLLSDAQVSVNNLNKITTELTRTDFNGLVDDVGNLVESTQDGVTSAVGKLNSVNIEQLNKAIQDMTDVIEPMANFFNKFKL